MLDIRLEGETVVVAWEGALDELAAQTVLAAADGAAQVVLDLTRATSICDHALARLAQARPLQFRGLRSHHERLLGYLQKAG
ncbi:MAG: STAS domain-containing protein [Myxococcales bacterium]